MANAEEAAAMECSSEVLELRECLKDAIELFCCTCADKNEETDECNDKDGACPCVKRWRKALEPWH